MKPLTVGSLFSGIGGFDLALERCGMQVKWQVENDEYCNKVLNKHWPKVRRWNDVKTFPPDDETDWTVDVIVGGFPCQPFSQAGKRCGTEDNRYLWPAMLRIISTIKPSWVIAENVRGILSINEGLVFKQVLTDLENEGYEVQPFIIPACAVNAPHRRDRVWIVAHSKQSRERGGNQPGLGTERGEVGEQENGARVTDKPCNGSETGRKDVAHSERNGRGSRRPERKGQQRKPSSISTSQDVADTHSAREPQQERHEQKQRRRVINNCKDVANSASDR